MFTGEIGQQQGMAVACAVAGCYVSRVCCVMCKPIGIAEQVGPTAASVTSELCDRPQQMGQQSAYLLLTCAVQVYKTCNQVYRVLRQ